MRRNSVLATRLSQALSACGWEVRPRRLEGWTRSGLGAPEGLSFEAQVAHYADLADVSRSGRVADLTAVRLAARGHACPRLRDALLRRMDIAPAGSPLSVVDLSTGPSGDEAFDQLEQIARLLAADTRGLPNVLVKVIEAFRRNADRYADELGESGDDIFHSFIVNTLCHALGGDLYNEKAFAAVCDIDPAEADGEAIEFMNARARLSPNDMVDAYRSASIDDVVVMARWLREQAPTAMRYLGVVGVSEAELDEIAGTFAPFGVYLLNLLRSTFEGVADALPALPAALAPSFGLQAPLSA